MKRARKGISGRGNGRCQDPETGGSLIRVDPSSHFDLRPQELPGSQEKLALDPDNGPNHYIDQRWSVGPSWLAAGFCLSLFLGSSNTICVHSSLQQRQRRGVAAEITWPPERTMCSIEPFTGRVCRPVHWTSRACRCPSTEKQCSTPASLETHSQPSGGCWPFPQASSPCCKGAGKARPCLRGSGCGGQGREKGA